MVVKRNHHNRNSPMIRLTIPQAMRNPNPRDQSRRNLINPKIPPGRNRVTNPAKVKIQNKEIPIPRRPVKRKPRIQVRIPLLRSQTRKHRKRNLPHQGRNRKMMQISPVLSRNRRPTNRKQARKPRLMLRMRSKRMRMEPKRGQPSLIETQSRNPLVPITTTFAVIRAKNRKHGMAIHRLLIRSQRSLKNPRKNRRLPNPIPRRKSLPIRIPHRTHQATPIRR